MKMGDFHPLGWPAGPSVTLWLTAALSPPPAHAGPAVGLGRVQVKPDMYVVVGGGSNSLLLVTDAGVVLVGAKESEAAGEELREIIAGVTNQPVRYVILPNHQGRSTHGSRAFPEAALIIAHERARRYMGEPPEAAFWGGTAGAGFPNLTASDRLALYVGKTRVEVLHPGRGHTDGDLVVLFPDQHVLYTGDLFWNHRLPFIDRAHGGSATALIGAMQRLLSLPGVDTIVPGYGDVGARADLTSQLVLLRDLQAKVSRSVARGRSRSQMLSDIPVPAIARSDPLERFEALLGAMYDELKKR